MILRRNIVKKKLVIGIIVTLLALTGIGYAIGDYFVNYALSPVSDSVNREINEEDISFWGNRRYRKIFC